MFVFVFSLKQRKSLDIALGFAAGVMIAASFWSLLAPAIELAVSSGTYGRKGEFAFIPVAGGFLLGSIFVFATDKVISYLGINSSHMMIGNYFIYFIFDIILPSFTTNQYFNKTIYFCSIFFCIALTHTNKDKADIALDDAENTAQYVKKTQYGTLYCKNSIGQKILTDSLTK